MNAQVPLFETSRGVRSVKTDAQRGLRGDFQKKLAVSKTFSLTNGKRCGNLFKVPPKGGSFLMEKL